MGGSADGEGPFSVYLFGVSHVDHGDFACRLHYEVRGLDISVYVSVGMHFFEDESYLGD